jgi:hypothetical protein
VALDRYSVTAYKGAMKTNAERQSAFRERMRKLGLVLRQVWVHPLDWADVKRYAERKRQQRTEKKRDPD